ncbi:hypothetical protein N7495_001622 [Penicillium taxi]|uniref:uncharacterized protein n=1 Tax=Penicillium taxi TaxID=168475 RepID=UPI002544FA10|nr:uncharacterized protein N7495_001622 [Penicillium taxi]KAJ5908940.1 hypothetical protein N7495_001622 [Penicillium taxi]
MGAEYLGLTATGWSRMTASWWERVLAILLAVTVALGSLYILYIIGRTFARYWRTRHRLTKVPSSVIRHLDRLKTETPKFISSRLDLPEPKAFGVYLGSFASPPNSDQTRLLSQWDLVVLDPLQHGVLDALTRKTAGAHTVARLDIRKLVATDSGSQRDEVIRAISVLTSTMLSYLKRPQDSQSPFSGVLLADCSSHLQPVVLNEVVKFINGLGLDVWMEFGPIEFLEEKQCREIDWLPIRGVIYRNGTVRTDGDRCNFFQQEKMRTVMRVAAAQKPIGTSTVAMWDTVDDGIELGHDVLHRSYKWCNYMSAMSWIAPKAALTDAVAATAKTVISEPIGALMWMKNEQTLAAHEVWRHNENITASSTGHENVYNSLQNFVPNLKKKLTLLPHLPKIDAKEAITVNGLHYSALNESLMVNPFSMSPDGDDYAGLGCFQMGLDLEEKDIKDLLQAQRQVRDLKLLDPIKPDQLRDIAGELAVLCNSQGDGWRAASELHDILVACDGTEDDCIRIYSGLHSGFRTRMETQVWGMYDKTPGYGPLDIYLSGKCEIGRTGAILHTYMSSKGHSRFQCFEAEVALANATGSLSEQWKHLPPRIVSDIEQLSPTEALLWLRRLSLTLNKECADFTANIRACTEHQLIRVPSLGQLRALSSSEYLSGKVSAADLVASRLAWYREQGCWAPEASGATALFLEIDSRLPEILKAGDSKTLEQIADVIQTVIQKNFIDAGVDFFTFAVFCAFRRIALDEVYLEVLDRNPLPNNHDVQASCFAEMFALGARCDMFFDMKPKLLGKIIAARYRKYYHIHPPPRRSEVFTEIPTAYASMDLDLDPEGDKIETPFYYRITFLGIFALPALIDIMMLTTVGRGLYLTTFMSDIDKTLATTALMIALLVCGGFGSWISSGGSYYLYAMAFPAMSMFIMTRFIAGVAVAFVAGIIAMIGIGCVKGFAAGVLFFLYFFFLSSYLMLLSVLAIYQMPGFDFQSGRTVIICSIPILFISPILTLWVGHDSVIYLCCVGVFLTSLLLGARRVISQWNTWYLNIPTVTDGEVTNWYVQRQQSPSADLLKELSSSTLPRKTLVEMVTKERKRPFWSKATKDPFVAKLADRYSATMFLLVWYCRYSRTVMPLAYSPTWNLQLKAAVDTMGDMQKGLKMHNAFLHWRHTGSDVWCGILYFIIALMDKWTALITGEALVGLSTASSSDYRLSVGFGLAYYLAGALFLDTVSQPLWTSVNERTNKEISSLDSLRDVLSLNSSMRRSLYWRNLTKFFFLHIWGCAVSLALLWSFEDKKSSTIMYLTYIGAYSGVLFYQYNRIFTGTQAAKCLALGSVVGFVTGITLHCVLPPFTWSSVIGLGAGTWTAAIYSMFMADIGLPTFKRKSPIKTNTDKSSYPTYTCSSLEPYLDISQTTMAETFDNINALSADHRHLLDPANHPGSEVRKNILDSHVLLKSNLVQAAFPDAGHLLTEIVRQWETGRTVVEFVSAEHLLQKEQRIRAVTRLIGNELHLFVILGPGLMGDWTSNIRRNCQAIAEAIVQATAEARLGLSQDHSMVAEMLVVQHREDSDLSVPEGVKYQLERNPAECLRVATQGRRTFLRHLLLGVDCDLEWDSLPESARSFLVRRCSGKPGPITSSELEWLQARAGVSSLEAIGTYVARYNLGVAMSTAVNFFAQTWMNHDQFPDHPVFVDSTFEKPFQSLLPPPIGANLPFFEKFKLFFLQLHYNIRTTLKFLIIPLVADNEYQRELNYKLRRKPLFFAVPTKLVLNSIWSFAKLLQRILIPLVLLHGRDNISNLYKATRGWKTIIEKDRILVESLNGPMSCFYRILPDGSARLYQYSGNHAEVPGNLSQLEAINTYSSKLVLLRREEYKVNKVINDFSYEYADSSEKTRGKKLPIQRHCTAGEREGEVIQYDERGYIVSGSGMEGVNPVQFNFAFRKNAKFDDELLYGEYNFPHIQIKVTWCMPPPNRPERTNTWIPYPRVSEAMFIQGDDIHFARWTYDHKFHPIIETTLNGREVDTPAMIREDWFHVLDKPTKSSFLHDNPIFFFNSVKSNFFSRLLRLNVKQRRIPTSRARTNLWKSWKGNKHFDAVTTIWLDELLLRSDRVLRPYWRNRDFGRMEAATKYLDAQVDTILARVDIDPDVSSWTPMAYKVSDLYSFGQGGDARINTRTLSTQIQDTDTQLHVLAMDTATWPNEPGGVSACRRDMINDLKNTRWHIISENANDYGVPKFQIERNVQSLTLLPQWGLDFLNPTHGVFQNCLDSAVVDRSQDTRVEDIEKHFIPILAKLVRCARTTNLNRQHIEEATNALVDLNTYFESGRSWNDVWMSDSVKSAWRQMWLSEDVDDAIPVSQWWNAELPSLHQLDNALDMWHRYLFIFSIPVPERIPDVFQVSHHFTGATYGVICKAKRKCALHVWDHCVSFREMTVFLSAAVSFDSTFVNTSLISLGHLACVLIEHHADVVLPCAEYFNPGWEVELGTAEGTLQHRRTFARKIDPVVNGITNMERYKPIEKIKTKTPTVVMLSHVRYVKDLKTAIMATDLIVNKWGMTDYCLHIYGDMERAPAIASQCQEVIASKGLREHVILKGLGNPSVVLQDAWLFMNSSISEGLPLAMGEAALTGVPVVCTDVGASFCVVTDRATGKRFSEVVAPNDYDSLARAQIRVLALLEQWAPFAEDKEGDVVPKLEFNPTPEEIKTISDRMYAKQEQRIRFGMKGRDNVLNSFSSHRYLREHEQMLWLGKYQSHSFMSRSAVNSASSSAIFTEKKTAQQRVSYLSTTSSVATSPDTPRSISGWRGLRNYQQSGFRSSNLSVSQTLV